MAVRGSLLRLGLRVRLRSGKVGVIVWMLESTSATTRETCYLLHVRDGAGVWIASGSDVEEIMK